MILYSLGMLVVALGMFYLGSYGGRQYTQRQWMAALKKYSILIDPDMLDKGYTHVSFSKEAPNPTGVLQSLQGRAPKERN